MTSEDHVPAEHDPADDDAIRALLERLARRGSGNSLVIERAAILAEGADCSAVVDWILAHHGAPEDAVKPSKSKGGGLHGARLTSQATVDARPPRRYVLPADALA
jgi:hypothetical protein